MANLEVTLEELKALEETLIRSISDLQLELGHTDSRDFKLMLRERKSVLEQLLARIQAQAVPA